MATVSIIVTTYNIERYVEESLRSVAAQTLSDIEVLVVDDGSSDGTPALIEQFCAQDPRFVPVLLGTNSPGGVATAANAGLDRATSPWIGFVDGDDFIEPTMFERLLEAALAYDAELAMCQYQEVEDGTSERKHPADANRWNELDSDHYDLDIDNTKTLLRFISVPWRKLYRRDLLESNAIRFPVGDYFYEDNPFHWFSLLSAQSIALVPQVLCYHRMGRAGQTMAAADSRLFQIFRHHDTIHDWLADRGLLATYATTLLGWVISQMEWISRRTPPQLRRELFGILVPIFAQYSSTQLADALTENNKGVTTQRMAQAVAKNDFATFGGVLTERPDNAGLVSKSLFHLRHSGPRRTATIAARYLREQLTDTRTGRGIGRVVSAASRDKADEAITTFGLMVLQRQLRELRTQMDAMQAQLARIEQNQQILSAPTGEAPLKNERV